MTALPEQAIHRYRDRHRGILYGVGVGPGDPDLMTVKAVRILNSVGAVFAAASRGDRESLATRIAAPHLKAGVSVMRLTFPMTFSADKRATSWEENARQVLDVLEAGTDAAFLTLGDPLIYSTFGYLMRTIRAMVADTEIRVIPGVTSYQAAAARVGRVLVEGEETLTVLSGVGDPEDLRRRLAQAESCVILKVYRNCGRILETLDHLDLTPSSVLVSRCGLDGEVVVENLKDATQGTPHYLSLLLVRKDAGRDLSDRSLKTHLSAKSGSF